MNYSEVVTTRRSIRKFRPGVISQETIAEILRETQMSPSWKNTQTAEFIVVQSEEMKQRFYSVLPEFNFNSAQNAALFVVMLIRHGLSGYNRDGSPSTSADYGWEYFDSGIACQTLCLSAWERGLATCIMGIYDEVGIRELLQIPEEYRVSAVIPMGYADIAPNAPSRKPLEEKVRYV